MPSNWARIDFGYQSLPINWGALGRFIANNGAQIKQKIGPMVEVLKLTPLAASREIELEKLIDGYFEELYHSKIDFFRLN